MQVGHAFGIIFAIIVMGFVILVGTGMFQDMMCVGNIGQTDRAVKQLEDRVDNVQALDSGSSTTFRMTMPSNAMVCFIDPEDPRPSITGNWLPDPDLYPVIEQSIRTGGYNVWIEHGCGESDPGYRMAHITLPGEGHQGNFCVRSGDTLMLTNVGTEVMIEKHSG